MRTCNPGYQSTGSDFLAQGSQPTDWKKHAHEMVEDYLRGCPGSYSSGMDGHSQELHNKEEDLTGEAQLHPTPPPGNAEQYLRCVFHLYVNHDVDSVTLLIDKPLSNGNVTEKLHNKKGDKVHWTSDPVYIHPNEEDNFRYRYVVKSKEGFLKRARKTLTFSGNEDEHTVKESYSRKLSKGVNQYDIFKRPSECDKMKAIFEGQMFYVKLLYQSLNETQILKDVLIECEHVGFGHPSYSLNDVSSFLKWINDLCVNTLTFSQAAFILSLLGQFFERTRNIVPGYACWSLGVTTADKILISLESSCSGETLPNSSLKFIKVAAEHVFNRGSEKGFLAFIRFFSNVLDFNHVVQVADTLRISYTVERFDEQVRSCLVSVKGIRHQETRKRLSSYIISHSPGVQCLWNLYSILSNKQVVPDMEHFTKDFAREYRKFISNKRVRSPDFLEPSFWINIPNQLKGELKDTFCTALTKQVESREVWSPEKIHLLKNLALQFHLHSSQEFFNFFSCLATHRSKEVVCAVSDLLDVPKFEVYWRTVPENDKENVCCSLLKNIFSFREAGRVKDQVLQLVAACEAICSSCSLKNNQQLCSVLEREVENLLQRTSINYVMDAYKDAQELEPVIQQRLMSLLRTAIKRETAEGDVRSRMKMMIRLLDLGGRNVGQEDLQRVQLDGAREEVVLSALELAATPAEVGKDAGKIENSLKNMISESELWLQVLRALHSHSCLTTHPKVSTAVNTCTWLKTALESRNLRVGFVLRLTDEEFTLLSKFCALVFGYIDPSGNNANVAKWKKLFSSQRSEAQSYEKKITLLGETIRFLQKVSKDIVQISDAASLISQINKWCKSWTDSTFKTLLDEGCWETLQRLTDLAEAIKAINDLKTSFIFFNVGRICLQETFAANHSAYEDTSGIDDLEVDNNPESTSHEVLALLANEGYQRFLKDCAILFDSRGDALIGDVDKLMEGIQDECALKAELSMARKVTGQVVPKEMKRMLQDYLRFPTVYRKVEELLSVFTALGFEHCQDPTVMNDLQELISCCQMENATLKSLSGVLEKSSVDHVDKTLDESLTIINQTLTESSELISFLRETADEDIRILIDAVEEHSDQLVSEATVSDLIDIHGFLCSILKEKPADPLRFLHSLKCNYIKLETKPEMAAKIKECSSNVHSLRGLYMNVANRGELTKEIIDSALKKGCYLVKTKAEGCYDVHLSYQRHEGVAKESSYTLADLNDLRSRALLIVNTDRKQEKSLTSQDSDTDTSANVGLAEFIKQVELITDILNIASHLQFSGHPKFKQFWKKLRSTKEIEDLARYLTATLTHWKSVLRTVRKDFYFLNFFHPDQLWVLKRFFDSNFASSEEGLSLMSSVLGLLRFVDPNVELSDLHDFRSFYVKPEDCQDHASDLRAIGKLLNDVFIPRQDHKTTNVPHQALQRAVKPGELFVAVLEPGSTQTVHTVMALFESTSGSYPQPSQILFCHAETTWEEIERLLQRSFEACKHCTHPKLHCLANVEHLSNDMQFELVAAIRKYQGTNKAPYRLSIVCCGGNHHHIVDQFSSCAHNIMGMSEVQLRSKLQKSFPNVFMVTSDLPGVGKTEAIHEHAASYEKRVITVPISGPLSRKSLVRRLANLQVRPHECVHFDVGGVDDPLVLDTFMFELIVVGMVSSGTELCQLQTTHIYFEIANTLKHWLRDSLPVTKCFRSLHLKLDGYQGFVVSQEPSSPVQVVCQYLHAFERGLLEGKDVVPSELKPLKPERCKALLSKHFFSSTDLSYNVVEIFINVFASQLIKFSASPYFRPHNLKVVLGPSHDVRVRLFKALLQVSKEFASRSVVTCKNSQSEAINKEQAEDVLRKVQAMNDSSADKMVERVEGMIHWADNNHLVVVFHTLQALTVSALYRELSLVPKSIQTLFKTQAVKGKAMEDFATMNQKQLQERLDLIVRTSPRGSDEDLLSLKYALTADNLLKMVLIIQRIQSRIPVIVMGETGCGKTSLVRYLAKSCDVPFRVFNFHAGITEEELLCFVAKREEEAKSLQKNGQEIWVFLDEINTCDYIGTINEMICHRSVKGRPLPANLVFIAACNPYRLRPSGKITTAGLDGKTVTDEYSGLVYRVHPLPETMIDYVWDYGSLSAKDERAYIGRMLERIQDVSQKDKSLFVDLLCASQDYIRKIDDSPYCVSLRDAHRCICLAEWFKDTLGNRKDLPKYRYCILRFKELSRKISFRRKSFVLGLAHCYQSRLPTAKDRLGYSECIVWCFKNHGDSTFQREHFEAIVRGEQEEFLERMELPEGTARNAALRENVFVMLVCILNRIPVFVVGKPGCSKSLSMQIIRSNLRGKDSKDDFLKSLPQLYVVSHQGSESSTSDGILKVFEKARKYKEHNTSGDVLPVVLLDEIGLAEVSRYNPLKVLHSLLEPGDGRCPDVAVVGISNWALDAAKMNRAIHLSRPEPDIEDLFETGKSLREADQYRGEPSVTRSGRQFHRQSDLDDKKLRCLAEAYHDYQGLQKYPNFHGLRDYYNLIKCLSVKESKMSVSGEGTKYIQQAMQRNFGGLPKDVSSFQALFWEKLKSQEIIEESYTFSSADLICDNLRDKLARHLMVITSGDSAIGILEETLQNLDKEKVIIFGSRFEEDISEDYDYRILSRIILCMERDCVLILRDLESIYGSLYDMLNQNYTVVGGKRNCRVALGAFSNPMCQVHDGFRCIVLIDQERVDFTDPPFLNRFEKQMMRFTDVLSSEQREIINRLKKWVKDISTIPGNETDFHEADMFIGFNEDTLPSLVLHNSSEPAEEKEKVLERCKQDLMMVASPDGVVRSLVSALSKTRIDEAQKFHDSYFRKPVHNGLQDYLRHSFEALETDDENADALNGTKLLVMTHDNINVNVSKCLAELVKCQTEKLSAFKSEKQLTKQLQRFWSSKDTVLVLQCKPELDAPHMLLAKSIIEQQRETYIRQTNEKRVKHVCIVVHVQRERKDDSQTQRWQFSFQSGWKQVTLDVLEKPSLSVTDWLNASVMKLLGTRALSFEDVASDQLLWCFTRIKYPIINQPTLDTIVHLEQLLRSCPKMLRSFKEIVYRWIKKEKSGTRLEPDHTSWQVSVACDRQALIRSSHLVGAIQHYISRLIREPLAKVIYFLEKESAWPKFVSTENPLEEQDVSDFQVWVDLILDEDILDISEIPDHQGAESYLVSDHRLQLQFPFVSIFYRKVEQLEQLFVEDLRRLILDEANLDENEELLEVAAESQLCRFAEIVRETIPQVFENEHLRMNIESYVDDLLDLKTASFSNSLPRLKRVEFMKAVLSRDIRFLTGDDSARAITQLHSLFWLNESSYLETLSVFDACHKLVSVNLCEITDNRLSLFQKMLHEEETSPSENAMVGNQRKNSIDECEIQLDVTESNDQHIDFKEEDSSTLSEGVCKDNEQGQQQDNIDGASVDEGTKNRSAVTDKPKVVNFTCQEADNNEESVRVESEIDLKEEDTTEVEEVLEEPREELEKKTDEENGSEMVVNEEVQDDGEYEEEDQTQGSTLQHVDACKQILVETEVTAAHWGKDPECKGDNLHHEQFDEQEKRDGLHIADVLDMDNNEEHTEPSEEDGEENHKEKEELEDGEIEDETASKANECDAQRFEDILVEAYCNALFPTQTLVKCFKDTVTWQQATHLFLSTVSKMGAHIPAFHCLRVCHDFSALVVLPENLPPYSLYMLGELGKNSECENYLDSQELFNQILDLSDELRKSGVQMKRLQEFLVVFFARCIDSNPDTPVLESILTKICSIGDESLMRFAGPVIHRILMTEEELWPGVFEELLHRSNSIEDYPGLLKISSALSALPHNVELDYPFAVACCDLIGEVAFRNIDLESISSSEDRTLLNFRTSCQIFCQPCEDEENGHFLLLCAIAYLRAFLASFAKLILRKPLCLTSEGEFSMLLNEVNAALSLKEADPFKVRVSELRLYLLKELRKQISLHEIGMICQSSPRLTALRAINWQDQGLVGKLSFDPFQKLTEKSSFQAALANILEKNDEKPLSEAISSMSKSTAERAKVAAVLTKSFYLVRSKRNLRDTEDKVVALLAEQMDKFQVSGPYKELLLRVTGQKDFQVSGLCVSPETTPAALHRATLILHLCILLTSNIKNAANPKSFFVWLLTNPMQLKNTFVLASGGRPQEVPDDYYYCRFKMYVHTTCCFCPCGTYFAAQSDKGDSTCPDCHAACKSESNSANSKSATKYLSPKKGYDFCRSSNDPFLCVRELRPDEFRVLHFVVHSVLYGGFALGLHDAKCLCQFMCSDSASNTTSGPDDCLQHIVNDLQSLCHIYDAREEDIIRFLHYALEQIAPILIGAEVCETEDARMLWEKKFQEAICPLLRELNAAGPPSFLPQSCEGELCQNVQWRIEEMDKPTFSDLTERNLQIPRLFRVTKPQSLENLRMYYLTISDEQRNNHPLLGLFFEYHNRLPLVAHLNGLLSWSRIVSVQ